jgi:hypothetical protein
MKVLKAFLIGMIVGALILAAVLIKFWPEPKESEVITVTVKEPVYISDISGQAVIPQKEPFNPDFKISVPVQGEFKTQNAEVSVKGETTVERTGDLLSVDTKFHEADIKVKYQPLPEPRRKLFEVGLCAYTDFDDIGVGWYFEKKWIIKETKLIDIVSSYRYQSDVEMHYASIGINF